MHVDLYNGRKMVVVVVLVLALYYDWRFCVLACLSLTTPNIRKTTSKVREISCTFSRGSVLLMTVQSIM